MHTFILQDWTTIRGGTGVNTITQGESGWLDLTPYQDVVFWVDVREAIATPSLVLQTSPTKDDSLFVRMTATVAMAAATTPTVQAGLMTSATVPLGRYLRWQIIGTPTWDVTFRILVAANSPGT